MLFDIIFVVDWVLPGLYIVLIAVSAHGGQNAPVAHITRQNYFESFKTIVVASGIAVAVIAAGLQQRVSVPVSMLREAAGYLIVCIVLSVATMLEMSRVYEQSPQTPVRARSLIFAFPLAYFALVTFLLGFSHLAQTVFSIEQLP